MRFKAGRIKTLTANLGKIQHVNKLLVTFRTHVSRCIGNNKIQFVDKRLKHKFSGMALVTGKRIKQTDRQTNKLVDYFKGIDSM